MDRLATYECWCCGGRVVRHLENGERAKPRVACQGWCPSCGGGQCLAEAPRVATERFVPPLVATPIASSG